MRRALVVFAAVAGFVAAAWTVMVVQGYRAASARIILSPTDLEPAPVALVLGASVQPDRRPSVVLRDRIEVGVLLLRLGKAQKLLLSGDNRQQNYNEVAAMRRYAIAMGALPNELVMDYAGRRTFDSCFRAREIFGLSDVIIVTQRFHLPRALYLCAALGLQVQGVAADRASYNEVFKFNLREIPAFYLAVLDVTFGLSNPVLGPPIPISGDGD